MGDTEKPLSPEAAAVEKAREYAERRRAEARARFDTPSWLGPARRRDAEIPSQPTPPREDLLDPVPVAEPPLPAADPIPREAHWVESARPRRLAGAMLAACVLGALVFLYLAVTTESVEAIVGLVACAFFAVLCRGAMMSAGLATVDLNGSVLTVRHDGFVDRFDLAGPVQLVELVGVPERRDWRLRLESADGRVVELGPRQVDAPELHRIVEYYRAVASRERRARDRRNTL